jgi:hypothetical protein
MSSISARSNTLPYLVGLFRKSKQTDPSVCRELNRNIERVHAFPYASTDQAATVFSSAEVAITSLSVAGRLVLLE